MRSAVAADRDTWEEGFAKLLAFQKREMHCRVPPLHLEEGFQLEAWVSAQRLAAKANSLSKECRRRLVEIGFVWDAREAAWEDGYDKLVAFQKREGHCRVSGLHEEGGFLLGTWANSQRQAAKDKTLSEEHRRRLMKIGFAW